MAVAGFFKFERIKACIGRILRRLRGKPDRYSLLPNWVSGKQNFLESQRDVVFVFMMLRNRKEESDLDKSFEACSSLITAVRNIFKQTKIQMDGVSMEYFIL